MHQSRVYIQRLQQKNKKNRTNETNSFPFSCFSQFHKKKSLCSSSAHLNNSINHVMHSSSCLHLIHHFLSALCFSLWSLCLCVSDRAVASVLQGGCPGEQYRGEEALGMHSQHYVSRATNLRECFFFFICNWSFEQLVPGCCEPCI